MNKEEHTVYAMRFASQQMLINKLKQENKELHNKIDKAIEYIDWQRANPQYDNVWRNYECNRLIEILKDSDVDE